MQLVQIFFYGQQFNACRYFTWGNRPTASRRESCLQRNPQEIPRIDQIKALWFLSLCGAPSRMPLIKRKCCLGFSLPLQLHMKCWVLLCAETRRGWPLAGHGNPWRVQCLPHHLRVQEDKVLPRLAQLLAPSSKRADTTAGLMWAGWQLIYFFFFLHWQEFVTPW